MPAPHLEFVTGKGGVGKSAISAAVALRHAADGARVLAIAARDPRGVGAHLGANVVDVDPRPTPGGVDVALISPGLAMQEYLRRHAGISTPRIALAANAFEALANAAPGVKEVITIGKAVSLAESGQWDSVIVDAPPTGQVAAYLGAPGTVLDLVPSGRIHEQAARLVDAISSAQVTMVTLLEELPARESLEAIEQLDALSGSSRIIANRVLASFVEVPRDAAGPVRDAYALHQAIADDQSHWRDQVRPDIETPFLFGEVSPSQLARSLQEALR